MTLVFDRVLEATGYLEVGPKGSTDVIGLHRDAQDPSARLEPAFSAVAGLRADAVYQAASGPMILIKDAGDEEPTDGELSEWRECAWNLGLAPLLWIITPVEVRVYDAYSGVGAIGASEPLSTYRSDIGADLRRLDEFCGRMAIESGTFWSSKEAARIDRDKRVDRLLLEEIWALETKLRLGRSLLPSDTVTVPLVADEVRIGETIEESDLELEEESTKAAEEEQRSDPGRDQAQTLVTCTLFAAYLFDRGVLPPDFPSDLPTDLAELLASPVAARSLFAWLHETFNGDVFPKGVGEDATDEQLTLLSRFAASVSLVERTAGQSQLFRFRFDSIPIELISSVYEAFARRSAGLEAKRQGLHYTPIELVHMALDPIFDGLPDGAKILDPTCGSGVFLVQSLRRLVMRRRRSNPEYDVDVRGILYEQIHGVDLNGAALRIAAFSLYLAVLELESEQAAVSSSQFRPLIGSNLVQADLLDPACGTRLRAIGIDAIVGNPPWTHVSGRRKSSKAAPGARRATDQDFVGVAIGIVGHGGRLAMYLKASPFFSRDKAALTARNRILNGIERLALIDLSSLRTEGLFPGAKGPAVLLCANCGKLPPKGEMLIGTVPWSADFRRSGMIAWGAADAKAVVKAEVLAGASTLKTIMKGTPRDAHLISRLKEERFTTLESLLDTAGVLHRGQGWQKDGASAKSIDPAIAALPVLKPSWYEASGVRIETLPSFKDLRVSRLHRQRERRIYSAPILIVPKSAHKLALQPGRLSAVVLQEDVAYNEGFYGMSFAGNDPALATLLAVVLNSAVASFQMLFEAAGLGSERPTIGPAELLALRVPHLSPSSDVVELARDLLERSDLAGIDELAFELYGLTITERMLVSDSVGRGRSTFLDTVQARRKDVEPPEADLLGRYASATCSTVNALLRFAGRRHLVAEPLRLSRRDGSTCPGFSAVRFSMKPGSPPRRALVDMDFGGSASSLKELEGYLEIQKLPYLLERRSLRIYGEGDVIVVKPSQRRYWSVASGLQDGDAILADHWFQGAA